MKTHDDNLTGTLLEGELPIRTVIDLELCVRYPQCSKIYHKPAFGIKYLISLHFDYLCIEIVSTTVLRAVLASS